MEKSKVLEVKKLIEQGFELDLISTELGIPIEDLERYKKEIDFRRRLNNIKKSEYRTVDNWQKKQRKPYEKIYAMRDRYKKIFDSEKSQAQSTEVDVALTMDEMVNMIEKMEKLLKIKNEGNGEIISKILIMYIEKIEASINQMTDINELKKLNIKINPEIIKMSPLKVNRLKIAVQSRIGKIQQQEAIAKIKNNVSQELEQLVTELANGKLNITKANKVIDNEVEKRRKKLPEDKFGTIEQNQREQVFAGIYRLLAGEKQVNIVEPEETIRLLMQLNGVNSEEAISSIVTNLLAKKEYDKAQIFINNQNNSKNTNQTYMLKRKVQIAKLSDVAVRILTSEDAIQQSARNYIWLENEMRKNNIKASQIPIGKIHNGMATIYFSEVYSEEKQR